MNHLSTEMIFSMLPISFGAILWPQLPIAQLVTTASFAGSCRLYTPFCYTTWRSVTQRHKIDSQLTYFKSTHRQELSNEV